MNSVLPSAAGATCGELVLVRHGETAWSLTGRHTGRTDLPLTAAGRQAAASLQAQLAGRPWDWVLSSPLQRALDTCRLAGLAATVELDPDLQEWDYGHYEGLTSTEIEAQVPGWLVFRDGCPGGESPLQVAQRADRVLDRLRSGSGTAVVFAHGHFLRVLTARWLGLPAVHGAAFLLDPATITVLSHYRSLPAIKVWNAATLPPL